MLTILAIKEIQIKTILRFYLTPFRISRTPPTTNVSKDAGKKKLHTLLV
jgi:hypothetical protein